MDLPLCRMGIPPPSILADHVHWFRPRVSNGLSTSPFPPFSFHRLPIARGRTCGMSGSHSPSPPSPSCTPCRCCVPFCVLRITSRGGRAARPLTLVLDYFSRACGHDYDLDIPRNTSSPVKNPEGWMGRYRVKVAKCESGRRNWAKFEYFYPFT